MADEVARPKIVLEVNHKEAIAAFIATGEASKDLSAAVAALGKQFEAHAEKSSKSETSIKKLMDTLSGTGATKRFDELAEAVNRMGGVEKLTATQTEQLVKQMERLKSAGGAVPASLQGVTKSAEGVGNAFSNMAASVSSQATTSMQGFAGQLGPLGSVLTAIGPAGMAAAAGIGAFAAIGGTAAKMFVEGAVAATAYADRFGDLSDATEIGTTALQHFDISAKLGMGSVESMTAALFKMEKAMFKQPEIFENLGLKMSALKELTPEQQIVAVADSVEQIGDKVERDSAALEIFGKKWGEIKVILKGLREGVGDKADAFGITMDENTIKTLSEVDSKAKLLSETWDGLWRNMGSSIAQAPLVSKAIDEITKSLGELSKKAKNEGTTAVLVDEFLNVGTFGQYKKGLDYAAKKGGIEDLIMQELQTKARLDREAKAPSAPAAGPKPHYESPEDRAAAAKRDAEVARVKKEQERAAEAERKRYAASVDAFRKATEGTSVGPFLDEQFFTEDEGGTRTIGDLGMFKTRDMSRLASGGFNKPAAGADVAANMKRLEDAGKRAGESLQKAREEQAKGAGEAKDWAQELQNIANMADFLPGIFGEVLGSVASAGTAIQGLGKSLKGGLGGLTGGAGLFSMEGLSSLAGKVPGMMQLAGVGLEIGKKIFGALHQSESEKIAKDVARDFGVTISEELAKTIEDEGKGRFDGALMHLGEMIGEAGGLEKFGAGRATGAMRDLFSAVDRGTITLQEAGAVFDDTFGEVAASQVSKTTGIATAQLRELVLLAKDFGLESEALRQFMKGQATSAAGGIAGGLGALKGAREAAEKRGQSGAGIGLAGQGAATGLSSAIVGDFGAMTAAGMSTAEALAAITPAVTAMREELTAAGLEGGAAFAALEERIRVTTDAVTGPLITSVGGFATSLVNLHNMNMLTAEDFAGITSQIGANILALEEQKVVGVDAAQALQPDLQKVWELQQSTGFAVDETTQGLINQAVEAGIVGEQHKSAADKMAEASERTASAVEFLAARFGYLAEEMNKVPSEKTIRVNTEFTSSGSVPSGNGYAGGQEPLPFAVGSGGFRDFGTETPAFLHGMEAVITPSDFRSIAATSMMAGAEMMARGALQPASMSDASISGVSAPAAGTGWAGGASSSSAGGGGITININGANKDPKQIADEVAYVLTRGRSPALLDEIRKRSRP